MEHSVELHMGCIPIRGQSRINGTLLCSASYEEVLNHWTNGPSRQDRVDSKADRHSAKGEFTRLSFAQSPVSIPWWDTGNYRNESSPEPIWDAMCESFHIGFCASNMPGFPILSLPVGASNDVCSRTIALHSAPWQILVHELASGDTGILRRWLYFASIYKAKINSSQCMILIDFVILQREMALASWFPGFWVCGFLGVLNHVLNTLSVFFSIYVFLLYFFRAWNQMPQQIAKPWYQPKNPKTQWINQTYPQKLQINHWINFTKINPKTTPILNEPWTKPEESQTNPE